MIPYYDQDGIAIYHGDSYAILPELPTDSVDLVLTDPPYPNMKGGYERGPGGVGKKHVASISLSGDVWRSDLSWVSEAWRVCRLGMVVFCSYHFVAEVAAIIPPDARIALVTWYKRNAAPSGANVPRHTTEYIWLFRKRPGLKWDAFDTTMLDIPNINAGVMATERLVGPDKRALHPTQKPVAVIHEILKVAPIGTTVLDPFVGTGTTLRACKDRGLAATGIDTDQACCDWAVSRLHQAVLPLGV